jgi:hypothetical protein
MTLLIELTPEDESRLRHRAAERGQTPEALAGDMLRSVLRGPEGAAGEGLLPVLDDEGVFHPARWEAVIDTVRRHSRGTPVLAATILTREALYQDHD